MSTEPNSVIVTGGTGGVGQALVRRFARAGWVPVIGFRPAKEAVARKLLEEIRAAGGEAAAVPLSLEDPTSLDSGVDAIERLGLKNVQALVLAASAPPDVLSFLKTPASAFRAQLDVHVVGNHHLIARVWKKFFRPRAGGHIVAILTEAMGPPPTPHLSSYTVAKCALLALLESAMAELGPAGLRVTAMSPGFTETPMLDAFPLLIRELARERSREKRFLTADEVAESIVASVLAPAVEPRVVLKSVFPP